MTDKRVVFAVGVEACGYVTVEIKPLNNMAIIPTKAYGIDAGWDMYAIDDVTIHPGKTAEVATGIAAQPPRGYYFTIDGRSSMSRKGLVPFRGIIDAGYTGEIFASLTNAGETLYQVRAGERIAQLILHRCVDFQFVQVEDFTWKSERGSKGFGSSGK